MIKSILNQIIHLLYSWAQILYGHLVHLLLPIIKLPPLMLRIRITNKCNLHCHYCYLMDDLNTGEKNNLELDEWEKIINKIPRSTIIDITGSEPFLAKNFAQTLDLFLDRKMKVSLITNGMIINESIIENMVKKKLFYLMLSVDGLKEQHNKSRGHNRSFDNLVKFIETVNTYKAKQNSKYPIICIKTTLFDESVDQLKDMGELFFNKLKIDQQTLNLMFDNISRGGKKLQNNIDSNDFYEGNTYSYNSNTIDEVINKTQIFLEHAKLKKWKVNIKPDIEGENWSEYIKNPQSYGVKSCIRPYSVSTLYYDGTLSPCDINFPITNIREIDYDIRKIWAKESLNHFLRKHFKKKNFFPACDACCLAQQNRK